MRRGHGRAHAEAPGPRSWRRRPRRARPPRRPRPGARAAPGRRAARPTRRRRPCRRGGSCGPASSRAGSSRGGRPKLPRGLGLGCRGRHVGLPLPAATAGTTSSSAVGATPRSRRPGRSRDATLSRRISATWLRVSGAPGANSARNARASQSANGSGRSRARLPHSVGDASKELRIGVGPRAAEFVAGVASAGRTCDDAGDRLGDILDVHGLQPRPAPAEEGIDRQDPEKPHQGRQEVVVRAEHDRRPDEGRAGESLADHGFALAPGADVSRSGCRIGADAGHVDQAFDAGLARQPGDARRRLDMDGAEGLAAAAFDVEADGVHGPEGAGERRGNGGLVMHVGPDRLQHPPRPAQGATAHAPGGGRRPAP